MHEERHGDKVIIKEEKFEENTQIQEKVYSLHVIQKAQTLGDFMCQDYHNFLEFVEKNPKKSIE